MSGKKANSGKMVTIPEEEYDELVADSHRLAALDSGGVDNWEWYSDAIREYEEENGEGICYYP